MHTEAHAEMPFKDGLKKEEQEYIKRQSVPMRNAYQSRTDMALPAYIFNPGYCPKTDSELNCHSIVFLQPTVFHRRQSAFPFLYR